MKRVTEEMASARMERKIAYLQRLANAKRKIEHKKSGLDAEPSFSKKIKPLNSVAFREQFTNFKQSRKKALNMVNQSRAITNIYNLKTETL
jgi:hypothetical protein